MAIYDRMTALALTTAKNHVYGVCQTGPVITLVKPGTKDEMGEILTETTQDLHSFPIRYSPFDRETYQNISWADKVNVIFYVATQELDDLSLTIEHIKQYIKIKHEGKYFELAYVDYYSNFRDDFLYLIIGAKL